MEYLTALYGLVSIAAIIIGPIAAVKIQKRLELTNEKRNRKLNIFKTLMATRAAGLSPEHVRALNMIDLEFKDQKLVLNAWKEYLDHLNEEVDENNHKAWSDKKAELLVNMLKIMGDSLGYGELDKVTLKKGAYFPLGHSRWELENQLIRTHLVQILAGQHPIKVTNVADNDKTKEYFDSTRVAITKLLSGEQPISIKVVRDDTNPDQSSS